MVAQLALLFMLITMLCQALASQQHTTTIAEGSDSVMYSGVSRCAASFQISFVRRLLLAIQRHLAQVLHYCSVSFF